MTARRLIATSTAAGAATFAAAGILTHGAPLVDVRVALLGGALGATVPSDLREHRIPNRVVLPSLIVTAPLAVLAGTSSTTMLAGLGLVALLLAVALAQPAAIGMGDVKLALLLAVGLGTHAPAAIFAGVALAAVYGLTLLARHGAGAGRLAIPLAPFFAGGALLALLGLLGT